MKKRAIYYRRKNKKMIVEGIEKGKTIYLFTLPEPDDLIIRINAFTNSALTSQKTSSFFTKEKMAKIMEKLNRLDHKKKRGSNIE